MVCSRMAASAARTACVRTAPTIALCALLAVVLAAFGLATSARAATLGAIGVGAGEFKSPSGLAVDQETGEVFVADTNNDRIDVFSASGAFLRAFGWGVASDVETLQTCTTRCFPAFAGSGSGELEAPEGIAVDNDPLSASHGDVYVWDRGNHRVQKFTASGEFVLMFGGEVNAVTKGDVCLAEEACKEGVEGSAPGEFRATTGDVVAVDPAGVVYVGDQGRVQEFNSSGSLEGIVSLAGVGAIGQLAVDSAKALYVKGGGFSGVRKYDLAGNVLGTARDATGAPSTIAVSGETLFVGDASGTPHVLQFSAEGELRKRFGAGASAAAGLAFGALADAVYALPFGGPAAIVPVPPNGPLVVAQSAGAVQPESADLSAVVNPEGPQATSYRFEYGPTSAYGSSSPTTPLGGGSFEDQEASATISGLTPGSTYHFRVVVSNAASETSVGPDETIATAPPVAIDGESVGGVSASSAQLRAQLNPHGATTEYHFEYGRTTAYEQSLPNPPAIAEGTTDVEVSLPIQELAADTTYHYRVVARNAFGESRGADHTFTTQGAASTALIDGRAWEMVSPPEKQGADIEAIAKEGAVIEAAEDGASMTYAAKSPVTKQAEGNRSIANSQVLSNRTSPGSWSTRDIATPHEEVAGLAPSEQSEYKLFSSNLETGLVEPHGATPLSAQATEKTPYRREADGSYTPLVTPANVPPGVKFGGVEGDVGSFGGSPVLVTATPDDAHVLLSSPQPLTPGVSYVSEEMQNVFDWTAGKLSLVSILPNGRAASSEGLIAFVGAATSQSLNAAMVRNAISTNGSRVVFSVLPADHIYMRDLALGQTVQLDAPEPGFKVVHSEFLPIYQDASSDGSRVFFLDAERLTADSTASKGENHENAGYDLYECEMSAAGGHLACALHDLSVDANPGEGADVLSVIGADETGRYVYFVANGRLSPGAVAGNCPSSGTVVTEAQSCNLYVRDTVSGVTRLIAVLSGRDFRDWRPEGAGTDLGGVTSRVSPDGGYLAFMSDRPLTGFDNHDLKSGEPDEEVFEYDLDAGSLTCVSCASSGVRPEGVLDVGGFPGLLVDRPTLWEGHWLAASLPGWTKVSTGHALYQSRYLSDSGRLFFNSATPLVPSDVNGVEDVYEYEPPDVGACELASGCVGLISSGTSSEESAFMDASADGSDVFFLTLAQLLPTEDTDNAFDIYDAHVCSSAAPCATPASTSAPPCGSAETCRGAPAPQPDVFGAPASQTSGGPGNPPVAPAAPVAKPKPPTRAQKLAAALKACKKDKSKKKRSACERSARKRYAPPKPAKKKAKQGARKR